MRARWRTTAAAVLLGAWGFVLIAPAVRAAAPPLDAVEAELQALREQNKRNEERIRQLEETVRELKSRQAEAPEAAPSPDALRSALDRYWGDHRFVVTGYGFARGRWNHNANTNTFGAGLNPIFLFQVSDRLLFSSELEFELEDSDAHVDVEYARADYFLNDYVTLTAGKFLLPFGEFIERLHPPWINKLVSHPLPFREGEAGGILPFTDVGVQVRGGANLGYGPGASIDYTVYAANGPRFETEEGEAAAEASTAGTVRAALRRRARAVVAGAAIAPEVGEVGDPIASNNTDLNRNKAFGARLGIQPFPYAWKIGRLRIGASTYNGEWDAGGHLWFTSWGIDSVYQYGPAELRGEYVSTKRELPGPMNDRRDGWYIQGAYQLASLLPAPWNRLELVSRYSQQDQRRGHEDVLPHARQVAAGVDYWVSPSVALKLEYDRDLPRGARDNDQIWTQLAVGF